jgi:hemolysin activation/secretion protein
VTGRWASPFSIGDNLDGRLMTSSGGGLTFGRVAYEAPVGAAGARVGGGISRVNYSLGGDLEVLDATGTADVIDLSASLPLIRSRARNLLARTSIEHKSLTDEIRAVGLRTDKTVNDASFALLWDGRDSVFGGGWGGASLTLWLGHLSIDDAQQSALDAGPAGRRTAGGYAKFALQASRLQRITDRNNLYVAVAGQLASRNLDASEKFALGGPKAVRAYPGAEVLVDDGMLVTAEWRYSPLDELAVALFYDAARGRVNHDPFDNEPDNVRTLRGPGVGLNWSRPGSFAANASLAWRDTAPAVSDGQDRNPRLYLQLQKSF